VVEGDEGIIAQVETLAPRKFWDYNSPMKNEVDTHVRIPRDLYRKIEALAKRQERSVNRQIIAMLRGLIDGEIGNTGAVPGKLDRDSK
jgi:hypothetical protein